MEEQRRVQYSGPVLIKKGEAIPENATPMEDSDVLTIQERRIKNFKPRSEMRPLLYGTHILSAAVAVSGVMINATVRKNFRLGGLRRMVTYVPTVAFPALFTVGIHELGIKHSILLGKEPCPTCIAIRSGVWQAAMGLGYPVLISVLSCLPIAREFYTLPMPAGSGKGRGYVQLLRKVLPASHLLLFLGMANLFLGMLVTRREMQVYVKHLSRPLSSQVTEFDSEILTD